MSNKKDKNQNIQVFVRLRPLNQRDRDIKSLGSVDVVNNKEVVVRQSQQTLLTKKFTFDRAFGPNAEQVEVYQEVVSPLIEEVLAGYNCTVFAYGQTGTGKTHTMVGESSNGETSWQNDPLAGIIPRALSQLFDELRLTNADFTVRVSYLELYNEELYDLLSTSEDNSKLRIYEDITRKGSNIVNGLEEITVYNKNEVYKIMQQGQDKRRIASTLMNAQSSRSHTVFTIVVHMRENSQDGEELVKIGKLNLVDLAGSENISKAGTDNPAKRERARECVNINQSLLTLGRVITALVEKHPHIPYRESKLTRILQESLGGRTKTSIIATISPGHKDIEETLSTLEYAYRAKNIQNKPEINQKLTKKIILKDYAEEIDRLKRDLFACREKNGVYLANETYEEIMFKEEQQKKEIQELLQMKKVMEDERDRLQNIFSELSVSFEENKNKLCHTQKTLSYAKNQLINTKNQLNDTAQRYEEQKHIVNKQSETEAQLSKHARELLDVAQLTSNHVDSLHNTVEKRRNLENCNLAVTKDYGKVSHDHREKFKHNVESCIDDLLSALVSYCNVSETHSDKILQHHNCNKKILSDVIVSTDELIEEFKTFTENADRDIFFIVSEKIKKIQDVFSGRNEEVEDLLRDFLENVTRCMQHYHDSERQDSEKFNQFVQQKQEENQERLSLLIKSYDTFVKDWRDTESRKAEDYNEYLTCKRDTLKQRFDNYEKFQKMVEEEKQSYETRLNQKLEVIEKESTETVERLSRWMAKQKRLMEEYVEEEKCILEQKLTRYTQDIQEQKNSLEKTLANIFKLYENDMRLAEMEMEQSNLFEAQCEKRAKEIKQHVLTYNKEFDEGTMAVNSTLVSMNDNLINLADRLRHDTTSHLNNLKTSVERNVEKDINKNDLKSKEMINETNSLFEDLINRTRTTVRTATGNVASFQNVISNQLNTVVDDINGEVREELEHRDSLSEHFEELVHKLNTLKSEAREELARHADIESHYLNQKYKLYSPTGKTPERQQYCYPKILPATSPHERLIERFRASRQRSTEDCITISESDEELSPPDSDNSLPTANSVIVKSTSETDIAVIKKQQQQDGKENQFVTSSMKKPSRLPTVSSIPTKKPLVERNEI